MRALSKQIPTNRSGPEEQCWRYHSCSAVSIRICRRAELQANSSLPAFSWTEAWRLQKFLPYTPADRRRWIPMVGMTELLSFFIAIRNNILDFCSSYISFNCGKQILYNQGGVDQKFKTGLSGYELRALYTDIAVFYYYYVTEHRIFIRSSLSRWRKIKFYFSLTWIENCIETVFSAWSDLL